MNQKMPYYMTYPMPLAFEDDRARRRDYEYMKSAYPDTAKRLLPLIAEELERMEYDGSAIYDEYPDQLQLRLLSRRILEAAKKKGEPDEKWLFDLIMVLTYHELLQHREDMRKWRRKYY